MKLQFLDNIKVFIFDIGKTLFDKNVQDKCSIKTIEALKILKSKGYKVGVCTMRTFDHIRDIIDFDFDFYILNNGSYVTCDMKSLIDEPLNVEITDKNYLLYTPYETYFSNDEAKTRAEENGFIAEIKGTTSVFYNLILFDIEKDRLNELVSKFDCYYWEKTKTVSIQKKGCSRVDAIKKLATYLNISISEILYFGDGPNDLEVIKALPYSIAMGDCFPELLKYATLQIDSCKNDGVAKFVFDNFTN
jgi:HAD hydrolase, family IIB